MNNIALLSLLIPLFLSSCCKEKIADKPIGGVNTIPIYNQAYQENYAADVPADILQNAFNGYVLMDPFEGDANDYVVALQANGNEVGAYISIGTAEDYRSDYDALKPFVVEKEWGSWAGEYFVSETAGALPIMKARIDQIADWGYDWVEFDNMDWIYDDDNRDKYKFQTSIAEGQAYYNDLCDYVHSKGMKCMAKNTVLEGPGFDGVLYESYPKEKNWWETDGTKSFLTAGKLVIVNHYDECACNTAYKYYLDEYGDGVSFICEDKDLKKYVHFNQ